MHSEPSHRRDLSSHSKVDNESATLKEQVNRYKTAFMLSSPGQAIVNWDGRYLEVNPSLCQTLGYTSEELLAMRTHDVTHPDDLIKDSEGMLSVWQAELPRFQREKRFIRKDGQVIWSRVSSVLIKDEAQQPLYFISIIEDITERKASEERLRERDMLLSNMGKFVPGIIHKMGFDAQGRPEMLYLSDRTAEMFELSHETFLSDVQNHFVRVHPDDLEHVRRMFKPPPPGTEPGPVDYEYRVILPTRGERTYGGHAIPVREQDGRLVWYGHTADLTDKKALQQARTEARVAADANRAKNEFLSRVSHELRTPLNAVLGFAQLLRLNSDTALTDTQQRHVKHIEDAGTHLLGIISDVLDLSRIEAGNLPLCLEPYRPSVLLSEATQLVSSQAFDAQIELCEPLLQADPLVMVDPIRLRQVMLNLLSNAVKYNRPQGKVTPHVWQQDERVAIAIEDTGPGLSEQQQMHLFEPFNRLGAEHSHIEGTGIGLVIVRKLLEAMGGTLEVKTEVGKGSTFIAWVPMARSDDLPTTDLQPPPAAVAVRNAPEEAQLVVLYAEDNEINIDLVKQVLSLRPHVKLLAATSGAQALAMAYARPPDLFLLDMHLGDMTGFDLSKHFQRNPKLRHIPRVAFSADAMPDQIHLARNNGFDEYLTKPVNVSALLTCIDAHVERMKQERLKPSRV